MRAGPQGAGEVRAGDGSRLPSIPSRQGEEEPPGRAVEDERDSPAPAERLARSMAREGPRRARTTPNALKPMPSLRSQSERSRVPQRVIFTRRMPMPSEVRGRAPLAADQPDEGVPSS